MSSLHVLTGLNIFPDSELKFELGNPIYYKGGNHFMGLKLLGHNLMITCLFINDHDRHHPLKVNNRNK